MKKSAYLLIACLFAAVCFSCSKDPQEEITAELSGKVLVLQSMDSVYCARIGYTEALTNSIRANGANPEIRFIYQCGAQDEMYLNCHKKLAALQNEGWIPDVICISEDRLLDNILLGKFDKWFDFTALSLPIVASGLHCPDWEMINSHDNVAVSTDLIDFETNLILAKAISGKSVVTIELDYGSYDMRLRNRLATETDHPPFVNNADFHIKNTYMDVLEEKYHDSIFISVFSNANPELNGYNDDIYLFRKRVLQSVSNTTLLAVKKDLDSDDMLNHSQKPQFAAIRDGFYDGNSHFLCGYFASYETVANDQGAYVARILNGEKVGNLPVMSHKKDYYADWEAMSLSGIKYNDFAYADNNGANVAFKIVGISRFEKYRKYIIPALILILLVFTYLFIAIVRNLLKQPFKKMDREIDNLNREFNLFSVAVQNTDCIFVSKKEDVVALRDKMHPDETIVLNTILYGSAGTKKNESPIIRLTDDGGQTWRRWQFRRGTVISGDANDLPGVFIDVEETYKYKDQMAQNAEIAEQIRLKENFVKNITHEIRTPLNAIVGFSQILGLDDGSMSEEERNEIAQYVHNSNADLSRIIDVILKFSRLESGRIDFDPEDVDIAKLITEVYETWKDEAPKRLEFSLQSGRQNVHAMIDRRSVRDIMGQYLSNAFKFTESGYVKIGWDYNLDEDTVLLYVEDTGKGVSPEKRKLIFNMFWKDDMFITGVGLGLSLAQTYTEKMGGDIVFQSKPGIGSLFGSRFKANIES